jgi:hypothetical protein
MISFLGYLAAVFLATSLLVTRALWFRWINLFGNLTFVLYGASIHAFPVILTNCVLFIINSVQLVKLYSRKEHFEFVQIHSGDEIVRSFLKFYRKDLAKYFPGFQFSDEGNDRNDSNGIKDAERICFMVLRDLTIANLFVARKAEAGTIIVEINYTVPKFRDYKVGKFVFDEESEYLKAHGVHTIRTRSHLSQHTEFLKRMGFTATVEHGEVYFEKKIA